MNSQLHNFIEEPLKAAYLQLGLFDTLSGFAPSKVHNRAIYCLPWSGSLHPLSLCLSQMAFPENADSKSDILHTPPVNQMVSFVRFDTKQLAQLKKCQLQVFLANKGRWSVLRPFMRTSRVVQKMARVID